MTALAAALASPNGHLPNGQAKDAIVAARAAGLRHVDDRSPGLRRRQSGRKVRQGKRWITDFAFHDASGRRIRDHATLSRIQNLAIPPAWTEVWICPDPRGHIQATGRDARGRKQYRYHPHWRQERDSTKYARMIDFGRALPGLRRRIAADLRLPGLPRRKVLATVAKLLETTFIRVGNEEYARHNNSFGLTTLKDRHVAFRRAEVRFRFRGKSGVYHQVSVHDPSIARIVRRCRDLPGQELFQYVDGSGRPANINSSDVNDYIRESAGDDFTAKDFRTWAGTVQAAAALNAIATSTDHRRGGGRDRGHDSSTVAGRANGAPRRPSNRDVVRAIEQVAAQLGNTPSVCRKCYVHPDVLASFMEGTLASVFDRGPTATARGPRHLRSEEAAVLRLLRRRASVDKADKVNKKGGLLAQQLRRSLAA